jgi:hypothetical protein
MDILVMQTGRAAYEDTNDRFIVYSDDCNQQDVMRCYSSKYSSIYSETEFIKKLKAGNIEACMTVIMSKADTDLARRLANNLDIKKYKEKLKSTAIDLLFKAAIGDSELENTALATIYGIQHENCPDIKKLSQANLDWIDTISFEICSKFLKPNREYLESTFTLIQLKNI